LFLSFCHFVFVFFFLGFCDGYFGKTCFLFCVVFLGGWCFWCLVGGGFFFVFLSVFVVFRVFFVFEGCCFEARPFLKR